MKLKLLYTCMAITGIAGTAFAQETVDQAAVQKIREEGMNHSKVMETAFYLTDVSGPRLANSPGLKRAQDWAVNQLKTWGMVNSKLEPWGKFGKGWEVQKNYAAITVPYYHAIIAIPKAWTPGTNGPIKGDVVLVKADTTTDLDKYKGTLAGKIVIFDSQAKLMPGTKADLSRYTDEELDKMATATMAPAGGPRRQFDPNSPQMAARRKMIAMRGAISKFLVDEKVGLILAQGRGNYGTTFTTNGSSYADTAKAVAPELETSGEDYLRILRLVKAGQKVTMEADIKTEFFTNDMQGYNVVAEISGTDKKLKDQVIMIGGHLDSWHGATGATDNAAGSAVMMEAMRILKTIGFKPKRTIRIALWSSEEQGLFGSRGYVAAHFGDPKTMVLKPEQAKLDAYYNLDNGTGKIRGIYLQGDSAAGPIFKEWLAPFKDLGATTVTVSNTGGTDHQSFDAVGLPGFQFIQDGMDYNTRTHHSNQDTYDRLSEDDLKQAATIVASFVYNTSERKDMIPRKALPTPLPATTGR
ncbi:MULTISPECIES: M20/M25/M40 family metallo-hydrolase [unclassified Mucilaginibacter]|uniref:M28 family metallopeptidase n=1 Tax=unclassified Mucilaginibacter TaxID=2617802 RepID=UPI002AC96120|nr:MULTISPECIES: M20/M25/M40 family metallo-hydrolase [unclassified Mucilaginibacter]MEB0260455.1 M20/M25/M40 family metallo-hydrolase [Mucilaginibacter sp. 10I4]MEB0280037.1 M20/M25/M40 family metallo-hydrolase [Mucilaginibacter sp. 10B2]MEB0301325.1 M20/M25/M40 family metallo-hydrolase [Mucilaginibacter sp. 5C4]WPX23621.1 M20/M25/M40 family metallo-hydrolase [Mucilaginibacter sp. 5C4]